MSKVISVNFLLVQLVVVLTAFQFSYWGLFYYDTLKSIVILLLLIISALSNPLKIISNIFLHKELFFSFLLLGVSFSLYLLINHQINNFLDIHYVYKDVFIIIFIVALSSTLELTDKQLCFLLKVFVLANILAALSVVIFLNKGLFISEQYLAIPKNQLSPPLVLSCLGAIYFSIVRKKIFWGGAVLFSFVFLLIYRGRASIVALIISLFFLIIKGLNTKQRNLLIICSVIIMFVFGPFILESLFLNKDISNLDDISSNRLERNIDGLLFLKDNHLLFGSLGIEQYSKGLIHLFLLKILVDLGLIVFTPLFVIYIIFFRKSLIYMSKISSKSLSIIPYLLFPLFIISFFEYTMPFSPISATFFTYLLLGQKIRYASFKK